MGRTQDITPIKHADDVKPLVEQHQIAATIEKQIETKNEQVFQRKDSDMDKEYDASKGNGGGNAQSGNGNRKKKKEEDEDGVVVIKSRATFDIKI